MTSEESDRLAEPVSAKPNIIVIMAADPSWGHVGLNGANVCLALAIGIDQQFQYVRF
jgi:arylsulfatase A-like enzyme